MIHKDSIPPIKRFFNLLQIDRKEIISVYVFALFQGLVALSLPLGIQAIINFISGGLVSTSWILLVVVVILGVAFNGVLQVKQLTITEHIQQGIFTRAAFEFAYRIPHIKMEAVNKEHVPELMNRFFDTLTVQKGLSKILMDFSSASLQVIFGLILLSLYHPFFILFSLLLIVIIYVIFKLISPKGLKTSLQESKYKYEVAHWLEELGRSMETFKLAGDSALPMKKVDQKVSKYLAARNAHFKTLVVQYYNLIGFKVFVASGLLIMGGLLVINQQMNIGQFVAAEIIIILVLSSVEKLIISMENIYDVLTAIEKIGAVTDLPLEERLPVYEPNKEIDAIDIRISELNLQFDGYKQPVLKNLNLNFTAGEKCVVLGAPGSGKTVFLQLLAALYTDYSGSISYNHRSLGAWNRDQLRSVIGDSLVNEDLFGASLFENIALDKPGITEADLETLVDVLGLEAFINSLPKGWLSEILPGGKTLPRNIKIKLLLARSLAGNPKLILLDNSIDVLRKAERIRLMDYLSKIKATVVLASHNIDVVDMCSQVLILDQGQCLFYGPRDEAAKLAQFNDLTKNF